jgi:predicted nuclease of predicted toxin-antitoxin system
MERADDETIWRYAREKDFAIVTLDSDFHERSLLFGYPPKIVWLKCGNVSTPQVLDLLTRNHSQILSFGDDSESGCLELS